MDCSHLTEFEIQAYLDERPPELSARVESHISACRECRAAINVYRDVYFGLSEDPGWTLSRDFSDTVIKAAGLEPTGPWFSRFGTYGMMAAAFATLIGAFVLIGDTSGIITAAVQWTSMLDFAYFGKLAARLEAAGTMLQLLIPGIIAVLTIWILDRHIVHSRRKPSSLVV